MKNIVPLNFKENINITFNDDNRINIHNNIQSYQTDINIKLINNISADKTDIKVSDIENLHDIGIVWIDDERIEYNSIDKIKNILLYCNRGTSGTIATKHFKNNKVLKSDK